MKKRVLLVLFMLLSELQADWTDKVTINGYFNFEFEQRVAGEEAPRADEYGSFDSDMFDLVVNVQPTDRLRVAVDLSWEHGSNTEEEKGNVGYEYAFAEYTLSDKIKIRAGKMFTPFGIYNEIHTAKPSTIILKEPNPTNKIYFTTNWYDGSKSNLTYEQTMLYPRWGSGIAMLGNSEILGMPVDYIVQVTNGDLSYGVKENEYDKDDNPQKAISARVRLDVTDDLQIGASTYHDKMVRYDWDDTDEEYVASGESMFNSTQGAQLIWHANDDFRLEMEYVSSLLDVKGIKKFRRSGYSIVPSYFVSERVNLYFLYAMANPNHNVSDNNVINYAPGVNIEVDDNMFIKADYFNVVSEDHNTLFAGKNYAEFRAALSIGF